MELDFNYVSERVHDRVKEILDEILGTDATGIYTTESTQSQESEYPEYYSTLSYDADGNLNGFGHYIDDTSEYSLYGGASRLTIIPENEDFIIKVPLTGICGTKITLRRPADEEDRVEGGPDYEEMDIWKEYYYEDYMEEVNEYENVPWEEYSSQFCMLKKRNSVCNLMDEENALVEEGIEGGCEKIAEVLLPNFFWGNYNEIPVYVQRKAKMTMDHAYFVFREEKEKPENAERIMRMRQLSQATNNFSDSFIYALIHAYGEDTTYDILNTIDYLNIDDMHDGNYGFAEDNLPVIFDYAGYDDSYVWEEQ